MVSCTKAHTWHEKRCLHIQTITCMAHRSQKCWFDRALSVTRNIVVPMNLVLVKRITIVLINTPTGLFRTEIGGKELPFSSYYAEAATVLTNV